MTIVSPTATPKSTAVDGVLSPPSRPRAETPPCAPKTNISPEPDYLDAPSTVPERGVVFLVHGWPDISFAWRYQIPLLASLGLRCIALDCIGYGLTGSSDDLAHFTYKTHADGIAGIAKALGYSRIVLGGHDWGGMVVWRTAQWYPELVTHVFSVATSFMPCSERYVSTEDLVKGPLPQFGYQLQLGDRKQEVGERVVGDRRMRRFLNGLYGGRSAQGKPVMTPEEGVDLDLICSEEEMVTKSPLLNDEVSPHSPPPPGPSAGQSRVSSALKVLS